MQINIKNSAEFERLLEGLAHEIVVANIHFKLRQDLVAEIKTYEREYNQSLAFWSLTFDAHLDATWFRLCRIYDQNSSSLNLRNWLETIQENLHIFDPENFKEKLKDNPLSDSLELTAEKPNAEQLDKDIQQVSEGNPLVKKLLMLRNNVFAHKSSKNVIRQRDAFSDYPLSYGEIKQLLDESVAILNRYSGLFISREYSVQVIRHDDYKFILKTLKTQIDLREAEIQKYKNNYDASNSPA